MLPNEVPLKASQYPISPFNHLKKSKIFHSQSPNIITSMILVKCIIQIPNKKSMFMPPSNSV